MKKIQNLTAIILIILLGFQNCVSDVVYEDYIDNLNDSISIGDSLNPPADSIDSSEFITVYSFDDIMDSLEDMDSNNEIDTLIAINELDSLELGNLTISFPNGICGNGQPLECQSDSIRIELIEFYKPREFIAQNGSTRKGDQSLVSAGGFKINFFDEDDNEIIAQNETGILALLPDITANEGYENTTEGYRGLLQNNFNGSQLLWNQWPTFSTGYLENNNTPKYYLNNVITGYQQIASPMNFENEQVISAEVVNLVDETKIRLFFVTDDLNTILELDQINGSVFSTTSPFESEASGKVIAISWEDDILKSDLEEVTVGTTASIELQPNTLNGLNEQLNELNN